MVTTKAGDGHLPTIEKAAYKPYSLPRRGVSCLKKVKTEYQLTNRRYLHDKRILQSIKKEAGLNSMKWQLPLISLRFYWICRKLTQISRMHLGHKTHGLCELHLHYSTHLTPISMSENLINTLTMRRGRKWGSGHLVRPEHSVQVQVPLSPECCLSGALWEKQEVVPVGFPLDLEGTASVPEESRSFSRSSSDT